MTSFPLFQATSLAYALRATLFATIKLIAPGERQPG
jgi:hypothetical protein